jgi:hypothetical protein
MAKCTSCGADTAIDVNASPMCDACEDKLAERIAAINAALRDGERTQDDEEVGGATE